MSLTLTPSRELPAVDAFIQCAMVMEAQPFLDALTPLPGADAVETLNVGAEGHHQQSYALGQLAGHTVLVITSGVGIANAAAAVARGLTMATPKIVIAGGTAGGLEGGIKVGDVAGAISTTPHRAHGPHRHRRFLCLRKGRCPHSRRIPRRTRGRHGNLWNGAGVLVQWHRLDLPARHLRLDRGRCR